MKNGHERRTFILIFCFCAFAAFLNLLVCSRSSPLYVFNNWDDANSYFTMGKGMMNGLVIYRDLYDQKGPYLYLLYGLAYLVSHRTFAGVFILELVSFSAFLYFSYCIMRMYAGKTASLVLLPLLGACVCTSQAFYWGGSAEELFLPLLAMGLRDCLEYLRNTGKAVNAGGVVNAGETGHLKRTGDPAGAVSDKTDSTGQTEGVVLPGTGMVLRNAVAAGIIMQVKYTWMGFYIAFVILFSVKLIAMKKGLKIFRYAGIFIGGIFLSMVPWLVYFGMKGALYDWYSVYIYDNVFLYSHLSQQESAGAAMYRLVKLLYWQVLDNPGFYLLVLAGLTASVIDLRNGLLEKPAPLVLFLLTFLGIFYAGGSLQYYCLTLSVFAAVGAGYIGNVCGLVYKRIVNKDIAGFRAAVPILAAIIAVLAAFLVTPNRDFMKETRDSFFLFRFADEVCKDTDPTLLNVNCLDAGLYTLTGIVPDCRYFQTNTLGIPVIEEGQKEYVKAGKTDYILGRDPLPYGLPEFYEEVDSEAYPTNGVDHLYTLYRKRK